MNRTELLVFLTDHKEEFRLNYGVEKLALIGSFARDEASEESDIDLMVEIRSRNKFRSYFGLLHFLEDTLHRKIDIAVDSALKPLIRKNVLRDMIAI